MQFDVGKTKLFQGKNPQPISILAGGELHPKDELFDFCGKPGGFQFLKSKIKKIVKEKCKDISSQFLIPLFYIEGTSKNYKKN